MLRAGMRELTYDDARAACMGGLVFGAGGGGLERGLAAARSVFQVGTPVLVELDELEGDDQVMVMTAVGAPGTQQQLVWPRDGLRALELACEAWDGHGAIVGTMTAHPGAFMAGTWLANALDSHLAVSTAAPTAAATRRSRWAVSGLRAEPTSTSCRRPSGGVEDHLGHVEIVARGPVGVVSSILHHASAETGGALLASRGPFPVEFLREHGAVGAVSACLRLGAAMLAAEGQGGEAMIAAIRDDLGARELGRGPLRAAKVARRENWDVGTLEIDCGSQLVIHVCNEYMAAELDGKRVATYPDLIVTLAESDGMPTPAAHREPGERIVALAVPRDRIPLGAGVLGGRRLSRSRAAPGDRARGPGRRLVTTASSSGPAGSRRRMSCGSRASSRRSSSRPRSRRPFAPAARSSTEPSTASG